jgi:hypothetical protein
LSEASTGKRVFSLSFFLVGLQKYSGYKKSVWVEVQIARLKTVIGLKLKARTLPDQRTESTIGVSIMYRMSKFG